MEGHDWRSSTSSPACKKKRNNESPNKPLVHIELDSDLSHSSPVIKKRGRKKKKKIMSSQLDMDSVNLKKRNNESPNKPLVHSELDSDLSHSSPVIKKRGRKKKKKIMSSQLDMDSVNLKKRNNESPNKPLVHSELDSDLSHSSPVIKKRGRKKKKKIMSSQLDMDSVNLTDDYQLSTCSREKPVKQSLELNICKRNEGNRDTSEKTKRSKPSNMCRDRNEKELL